MNDGPAGAREINLTDGRAIPVWFDLADPFAPEVLAEKLQRKSSTIIGEAALPSGTFTRALGSLARDIASAMLRQALKAGH